MQTLCVSVEVHLVAACVLRPHEGLERPRARASASCCLHFPVTWQTLAHSCPTYTKICLQLTLAVLYSPLDVLELCCRRLKNEGTREGALAFRAVK